MGLLSTDEHGHTNEPSFLTLSSPHSVPMLLNPRQSFRVDVRATCALTLRLDSPHIHVNYIKSSTSTESDEHAYGVLDIPVYVRAPQDSALTLEPQTINFGTIPPNHSGIRWLHIRNPSSHAHSLASSFETPEDISVSSFRPLISAQDAIDLKVTWTPRSKYALESELKLQQSHALPPLIAKVIGTSFHQPHIDVEPLVFDVGEKAVETDFSLKAHIRNLGPDVLSVEGIHLTYLSPDLEGTINGIFPHSLTSLSAIDTELKFRALSAGPFEATLRILSSDQNQPVIEVPIVGLATKARLHIEPNAINFGTVSEGWIRRQTIQLTNTGFGALTLKNFIVLDGSSPLFSVTTTRQLPLTLRHNEHHTIEIEFHAEAQSSFSGHLGIQTSKPQLAVVPLRARVVPCEIGCQIPNGTPSCASSACAIQSCATDWYDIDRRVDNGCECTEPGSHDEADTCTEARYLGSFKENGHTAEVHGIIPSGTDTDIVRFHARDNAQFLRDDFHVRIILDSLDPSLSFCVYRYKTSEHLTQCHLENVQCGIQNFEQRGAFAREDGEDYVVRISRDEHSFSTCEPYTLTISNGK